MPEKYRKRLLSHLSHGEYEPKPIDAVAAELNIDDVADFADAVRAMAQEGAVALDKSERIRLPSMPDDGELTGTFRGNAKGFGFVIPSDAMLGGDVFIPPGATNGALTGDTVRVWYERDRRRERRGPANERSYAGEVLEIVSRKRANFTGEMIKQGAGPNARWLCQPDGKELTEPIIVRDASSKNVRAGDKVVLEIIEYPENGALAEGVIVKVLGEAGWE